MRLGLASLLWLLPPVANAAPLPLPVPAIEGTWQGLLAVGAVSLHLVVHLHQVGDTWSATLDSPDQGGFGIPADQVGVDGDQVTFKIARLGASFSGQRAGDAITGTFKQRSMALPLV